MHPETNAVIEAVNIIFGGQASDPAQFRNANIVFERIKSSKDFNLIFEIGSYLIRNSHKYSTHVLHFGLQLIESGIKLHWKSIDKVTRNSLKTFLESLVVESNAKPTNEQQLDAQHLNNGIHAAFNCHTTPRHIYDGLSKCYCEVIRREWPQHWPNMLDRLLSIKRNKCVLYILWRLAEDIGIFNEPSNNLRRREITNGLVAAINDIYLYISDCISSNNLDLISTSMQCLTGFITWSPINNDLMRFLCQILSSNALENPEDSIAIRTLACDSIIACQERKHLKIESKDAVQSLFEDSNNLASIISTLMASFNSSVHNAKSLSLQKKLCEILASCLRTIMFVRPQEAKNLEDLYNIMQMVLAHPSIIVSIEGVRFWTRTLMNNSKKSNYNITDDLIAPIFITCANKLVRAPYDLNLYGYELDCQQEFDAFQNRYRSEVSELSRALTTHSERICFEIVCTLMAKSLEQQNRNLMDWDALATLSGSVCNRMKETQAHAFNALQLAKALLSSINTLIGETSSPTAGSSLPDLISSQLSCLSALLVFLPHWYDTDGWIVREIIEKLLFLTFQRPDKSHNFARNQAVGPNITPTMDDATIRSYRALSRHASACFVKICQNSSKQLLNLFPFLKSNIERLSGGLKDGPFSLEKCLLYEGLVLVINEESNPIERKKFVIEMFESIKWFRDYELSCDQFIEFAGLDGAEESSLNNCLGSLVSRSNNQTTEISNDTPVTQQNRIKLSYVVTLINGIVKRLKDRETLLPELLSFVKPIINIVFTMNTLCLPDMQAKCHKDYRHILFAPVSGAYKQQILDSVMVAQKSSAVNNDSLTSGLQFGASVATSSDPIGKTTQQYLELFSWSFYEQVISTLSLILAKASPDVYTMTDMPWASALACCEYLPVPKLRKLTKLFVMTLVTTCGADQGLLQTHLLPLLSSFLPFMFNRLDAQWKRFAEEEMSNGTAGGQISKSKMDLSQQLADEVVQDQLLRNLSRDFIDLMYMILIEAQTQASKSSTVTPSGSNQDLGDAIMMEESQKIADALDKANQQQPQQDTTKISMLGLNLLHARPDFIIIVMSSTLTWSDSSLNSKSITINTQLFKQILSDDLIKSMNDATILFGHIIKSLGMFGEHEQNMAGLVQLFLVLYEGLSKRIPDFFESLERLTAISAEAFRTFDREHAKSTDKTKRTAFRKLIDPLIGKNIGQVFKFEKSE